MPVLFTNCDLLTWKQDVASHCNPNDMHNIIKFVMMTRNPSWGDTKVWLEICLFMKEKRVVLEKAEEGLSRRKAEELNQKIRGAGIPNPDELLPKEDFEWD